MGQLLVVAPNADLRHSLRFSLEAEGYAVTEYALLEAVHEPPGSFSCVILDHHGADGGLARASHFVGLHAPVVLLANRPGHPLSAMCFSTVLKPQLGAALSLAVAEAIAARGLPK